MVSYETIKQRFKSFNIGLITVNIISLILSVIGIIFLFFTKANLSNPDLVKQLTAEQLATLKMSVSDFNLFILSVETIILLIIIIYSFLNFKALRTNQNINLFPYYMGAAIIIITIIRIVLTGFSIINIIIQLFLLALYYFTYRYASIFNKRDIDVIEGELN